MLIGEWQDAGTVTVLGDGGGGEITPETIQAIIDGVVAALGDLPEEEDVRAGVEYGGGLYTGVLDVGTGLPIPEYPPGSSGL